MTSLSTEEHTNVELLQELFAWATHTAAAAICRWTNSVVQLTLDEIQEIPLEDACNALALGDRRRTMVALTVGGGIGGSLILAFEGGDDRRLAALLLGDETPSSGPWTELERSALAETCNILGCAYLSSISRLIERSLIPSAPYFVHNDRAGAIQQALTVQSAAADSVLVCRTGFRRAGEAIRWELLFVPTVALRTMMENAIEKSHRVTEIKESRS
jgi:chemotaxis protein CheC